MLTCRTRTFSCSQHALIRCCCVVSSNAAALSVQMLLRCQFKCCCIVSGELLQQLFKLHCIYTASDVLSIVSLSLSLSVPVLWYASVYGSVSMCILNVLWQHTVELHVICTSHEYCNMYPSDFIINVVAEPVTL